MTQSKNGAAHGSTTGAGAPAPSDRNSLTVGPNGPILLHDVHFLEQMAHFNREKVPERQPHAKSACRTRACATTIERAFEYWKSVDPDVGRRIEEKVRTGQAPEPAAGMGEA